MAHEVYQREDGTLGVRIPETVWNAFDKEEKTEDFVIDTPTKSTEKVVAKEYRRYLQIRSRCGIHRRNQNFRCEIL